MSLSSWSGLTRAAWNRENWLRFGTTWSRFLVRFLGTTLQEKIRVPDISPNGHFPNQTFPQSGHFPNWGNVWLRKCPFGEVSESSCIFVAVFCMKKKLFFNYVAFQWEISEEFDFTRCTRHFFVQPKITLFWTIKSYQRGFSGWFILIRCEQDTKKVAPLPKQNPESERGP